MREREKEREREKVKHGQTDRLREMKAAQN